MRKTKILLGLMAMMLALAINGKIIASAAEGDVAINTTNFPDAVFRNYVKEKFDTDKNGVLSAEEIGKVGQISLYKQNVSSLQGVEYFTSLYDLYCVMGKGNLTALDLSKNTELEYLYCYDNQLESLDISNCTKLKKICGGNNQLTSLDVSNCPDLEVLECYENQLTSLDVSKCTKLKKLDYMDNEFQLKFISTGFSIEGVDVFKMHIKEGGYIKNGLIVPNKGSMRIAYTYDVGSDIYPDTVFALVNKGHEHVYDGWLPYDDVHHVMACECGAVSEWYMEYHKYESASIPATFDKDGAETKKCTVCGHVCSTSDEIPAIKTVELSKYTYTYSGKERCPTLIVKDKNGKEIPSKYYTVKMTNGRKNVGKYNVSIVFKDKYEGAKKLSFIILPKGNRISAVVPASKGFTVKWTKQDKQTTGYQIQYSLKADMKGAKKVAVNSTKTLTKTLKNLKPNRKYYVQVRTFKKGKYENFYSAWSKVVTVKTKK